MDTTIEYAKQIAQGLNAAHNKGIIHRDIKSSNIMITNENVVKIMDFGLAKFVDVRGINKDQSIMGTIAYMAPEQIKGQPAVVQTDVFSFGVVLYEMITGTLPFDGLYEAEILYAIINEDPQAVNAIRSECPASIADIVTKCLEKEPKDRFRNMTEIIAALNDDSFQLVNMLPSGKHNLPTQLTSFIGRIRETETIKKLLFTHRIVTLTGAGGCGKSRLAQQVAAKSASTFSDGVWLVELAALSDPERIPQTFAAALGITEEANVPLEETIIKNITNKNLRPAGWYPFSH